MREAAADLEFEEAARIRDEIRRLEATDLGVPVRGRPAIGGAGQPYSRETGRRKKKTKYTKRRRGP